MLRSHPSIGLALGVLLAAGAARATTDLRSPAEEDRIVRRLESDPARVVSDRPAGGGVTGARLVVLRFADGEDIALKWKRVPAGMDGSNNSPRKEIAAYQLQRLFLDPPDHVIPTTILRCLPLEAWPAEGRPDPNPEGAACVLGEAEVWLDDVHVPERIYDEKRFGRDPVYAGHVADMNLVTYLIGHRDGRSNNFLMSNDPGNRRVFSIDNGISFDPMIFNYFVRNWHEIRVAALRRAPLERLRALPPAALDRLLVVAEMERGEDGIFRHTEPTAPRAPSEGIAFDGRALQLGLSRDEIRRVRERIDALLEAVDSGAQKTF